jgi:hypothetical protein
MKKYLAFVGNKRTSVGSPNGRTGRLSTWGKLYAFETMTEREMFCAQYDYNFNGYPIPCNKTTARKYFLGMSVHSYNEYINALCNGYISFM